MSPPAAPSYFERNPFQTSVIVGTVKTSAADLVAQVVAEKKTFSEIDWRRNAVFIVFGSVYLGGFQYWIMVHKYRAWFPTMDSFAKLSIAGKLKDRAGMLDAGKMVMYDLCVHLPFMYFPSFYCCKEVVFGESFSPFDIVRNGVTKYAANARDDITACLKLWGPSDCIQFSLPVHLRMPFRHVVSFFWTSYVSFTRGAKEQE